MIFISFHTEQPQAFNQIEKRREKLGKTAQTQGKRDRVASHRIYSNNKWDFLKKKQHAHEDVKRNLITFET